MEMNISQQVEYRDMQDNETKALAKIQFNTDFNNVFAANAWRDELSEIRHGIETFLEDNNISEV